MSTNPTIHACDDPASRFTQHELVALAQVALIMFDGLNHGSVIFKSAPLVDAIYRFQETLMSTIDEQALSVATGDVLKEARHIARDNNETNGQWLGGEAA